MTTISALLQLSSYDKVMLPEAIKVDAIMKFLNEEIELRANIAKTILLHRILNMSLETYARHSLRQDAAMRASRDGDISTLCFLIDQAQLFENPIALRRICESGEWGDPKTQTKSIDSPPESPYSTKDSILLHNLLLSAVTRAHAEVIELLLDRFPAKNLHVAEWELVMAALGTGEVKVLKPFVDVDPNLITMLEGKVGNCFEILFSLSDDSENIQDMTGFLFEKGADPNAEGKGDEILEKAQEILDPDVVQTLRSKFRSDKAAP